MRSFSNSTPRPHALETTTRKPPNRHNEAREAEMSKSKNNDIVTDVLSNRAIVAWIADFQPGYPQAVAAMVRLATKEQLVSARGSGFSAEDQRVGMLPRLAVAVGDPLVLKALFELKTQPRYQHDALLVFAGVMALAVRYKRVDMLACLAELKTRDPTWEWEPLLMSIAAEHGEGDLRVLEWLFEHLPREMRVLREDCLLVVVRRGSVEEVRWMHERGYDFSTHTADCAAASLLTNVLEYFYQCTSVRRSASAVWHAVTNGSLEIVKIVIAEQTEATCERALEYAAHFGHLDLVQYLVENGVGVTSSRAIDEAAQQGSTCIVMYLHEHLSSGCTSRAMDGAASGGHLDVLKFLHENRGEGCSAKALDSAAEFGHLDIVKFLHENRPEGCSSRALESAVENQHLDVVEFLCEHRSEGDISAAMAQAAARGHTEMVKLLYRSRRTGDPVYPALKAAALSSRTEIIRFLRDNHHRHRGLEETFKGELCAVACRGHLQVVKSFGARDVGANAKYVIDETS
ncbi:hypothetical protein PybrP1_008044 [[Pythium] brassicae (nom. inval.)]|nr:hypothetical protein PybrP1_008044 [[Pythium] brassicae (nom. inval.)]